ncbi:MAG: glucosamine-6-phosphate deaminase [Culicoidibacterales bacterium]
MKVVIVKNYQEASEYAAKEMLAVVKSNPKAVLGLATGSTPVGMYNLMVKDHKENGTDYSQVESYNLDEYINLPANHADQSYRHFMDVNLFDHLNITKANTHVPEGTGEAQAACEEYDAKLAAIGGVDIQVLGIGSNGHIAFNEPGVPFELGTHIVTLDEQTREDNARFFDSIDEVPTHAITMGIKSIKSAKKIILIASGENKADAVKGMIEGEVTVELPASALQDHSNVIVIVDEAAASKLTK